MNNTFDTDIGKIYCTYNKKKDIFEKIRIIDILDNNKFKMCSLDSNNHLTENEYIYSIEELKNIKKECVSLKSDGIISISNIVAMSNDVRKIKDILVIYFPNNKITSVPEINQPYIIARQGINNIFANMADEDTVGMAVSLDTLPAGYALSDFMINQNVISSRIAHVYKTDSAKDLEKILNNNDTKNILKDLYDHAQNYRFNTIPGYVINEIDDDCIGGYCNTLNKFLVESDFMGEFYNNLEIVKIDFELIENNPIEYDDKLLLSTLCGGIKINKAVPMKFDYDINTNAIKMRYILVSDINDNLFIVIYTVSDNEIDADSIYKLTEESTIKLQNRLKHIVKIYDDSVGKPSVPII